MSTNQQMIRIRTRKLGLLITDARLSAHKEPADCADALGIPLEQYLRFEKGEEALCLPELEALAYFLNVPLEHFWGHQSLTAQPAIKPPEQIQRLTQIRNRMIGTSLRITRTGKNVPVKDLADACGLSETDLRAYEQGERALPLPVLEALARELDLRVESFFDQHGPIGAWRAQQQAMQKFLELSPDMQSFVCKSVNRPYLELAMRLSELNVDKLRSVAEGLLEITY